jgi:hypothetical protein
METPRNVEARNDVAQRILNFRFGRLYIVIMNVVKRRIYVLLVCASFLILFIFLGGAFLCSAGIGDF